MSKVPTKKVPAVYFPNITTVSLLVQYYEGGSIHHNGMQSMLDANRFLVEQGLLDGDDLDEDEDEDLSEQFSLSDKGRFWVEHILNIPVPVSVQMFTIQVPEK